MRKLDGVKNDDYFLETEGVRSWVYQRHECLLKLLRAEVDWRGYIDGLSCFSFEERQACKVLRQYLGLDVPHGKVGVYIDDRSFYRKAIEYLREYSDREQQDDVPRETQQGISSSDTAHHHLRELLQRTDDFSRDPVIQRWIRTYRTSPTSE